MLYHDDSQHMASTSATDSVLGNMIYCLEVTLAFDQGVRVSE